MEIISSGYVSNFRKHFIFKTCQKEFQMEYNFVSVKFREKNVKKFLFDVAVMVLKTIKCFKAEIMINLIFKIGKNHIQLLTALVKT